MRRKRSEGESVPMTLGQALAAKVRLIEWCKAYTGPSPLSPRIRSFKSIPAKLDPPASRPEPLPPPKPPGERSVVLAKKRRR